MENLRGKNILIGVTGSIAAYKSAQLIRLFVKAGANVQVIMTPASKEFISPLTLSTLSGNPVLWNFFEERTGSWNSHVDLGVWADVFIIAPATASTLGKMTHGIADNLLITTYLSCRAPVIVAPAMDLDMFAHPSTALSIQQLSEWGVMVVEPKVGELASHLVGKGRMAEPEEIFETVTDLLLPHPPQTLEGVEIMITSGPTYEKIDPVRFIGNYSTGKMGLALAEAAVRRGASVRFITGPVDQLPKGSNIKVVEVESAEDMLEACREVEGAYEVAIFCAAVADYRPTERAEHKIKREEQGAMSLDLIPNPDIAATMGREKEDEQIHIGFALETNLSRVGVLDKMERKNFDLIVANSLQDHGAGFGGETNKVTIFDRMGGEFALPLMSKKEVAENIMDRIEELLGGR